MMRYRLRTLLILLAVGPIVGAQGYRIVDRHLERQRMRRAFEQIKWEEVGGGLGNVTALRQSKDSDRQTTSPLP
jgi:hypothetical protein